jgi:hypothetical protein
MKFMWSYLAANDVVFSPDHTTKDYLSTTRSDLDFCKTQCIKVLFWRREFSPSKRFLRQRVAAGATGNIFRVKEPVVPIVIGVQAS